MASMGGVMKPFSTQTSMAAAPDREAGRIYCLPSGTDRSGARFLRPGWVFGIEGSLFRVDPSPRLRLATFNGRRPTRERLERNRGGTRTVFRFLFLPSLLGYKKTKSKVFL